MNLLTDATADQLRGEHAKGRVVLFEMGRDRIDAAGVGPQLALFDDADTFVDGVAPSGMSGNNACGKVPSSSNQRVHSAEVEGTFFFSALIAAGVPGRSRATPFSRQQTTRNPGQRHPPKSGILSLEIVARVKAR